MFQKVKCDELFNFEEFNHVIDLRVITSATIPFLFKDVSDMDMESDSFMF